MVFRTKELLKLADFPEEGITMEETIPFLLKDLHAVLPFKRYLLPSGPLNLVSNIVILVYLSFCPSYCSHLTLCNNNTCDITI